MTTYNCDHCRDTGKRILPNGEHSDYVDCSCQAATERAELDVAVTVFVQSYEGDLQNAPADTRWFVHQRAVKMQAARIADLERQLAEYKQAMFDAGRIAAAASSPAVAQQIKLDDIEQYRQQMAGISTAALGYWKEGDSIHPDYDTIALRDVAKLYAKYEALYKAYEAAAPQAADTDKVREAIPDGWQLVPTTPTTEMFRVGCEVHDQRPSEVREVYSAMLAAAPLPAAPVREVPDNWISVDDRLPEMGMDEYVWAVWDGAGKYKHAPKQGEARFIPTLGWQPHGSQGWDWRVSHWQPLPALPAAPIQQEGEKP